MSGENLITLGVEEELFLVDLESRKILDNPNQKIFEACKTTSGPHKIVREFLRSQIETNTKVCSSIAELREALSETRKIVVEAAEQYGACLLYTSPSPRDS